MATDRRAEVNWQGSLMEGSGTIRSTTSGKLGEQKVSWACAPEVGRLGATCGIRF